MSKNLNQRKALLNAKHLLKPLGTHNYFVYITTNRTRKVLYTGVTDDLKRRVTEHEEDAKGPKQTFAGKYNCYYLVFHEFHQDVNQAIAREKEIKGWSRAKKINLIESMNPEWRFLNEEV